MGLKQSRDSDVKIAPHPLYGKTASFLPIKEPRKSEDVETFEELNEAEVEKPKQRTIEMKLKSKEDCRSNSPKNLNEIPATQISSTSVIKSQMSSCYLGARHSNEIDGLIRSSSFGVYYKLPSEPDDVEYELPLIIGYKSYKGKVYHLRVKVNKTRKIYVQDGSENPREFKDLSELIHYYERCLYVHPNSKSFEMFPIWLLDNIE